MAEKLRVLYDGQCSLCRRAMRSLKRHDANGSLAPEDVSVPGFEPGRYGLTPDQVRAVMHVVLPDGRVLRAMGAVRAAYSAVGRGWLLAPTGWPGIRWLADAAYDYFARHRMTFSRMTGAKCESGSCGIRADK